MQVTISFRDQVMARYANQLGALGQGGAHKALSRAMAHTGAKAKTAVGRALVQQTGLKSGTIRRAVRSIKGDAGSLSFTLKTEGGNIRLKHFGARETAKGVSAAPWNARKVHPGTFMRAGWWPKRVGKPGWNGQVFERVGGKTKNGKQKFQVVRSGVYIPEEMVKGASLSAWNDVINNHLVPRVGHEISRMLPG
jgi:hypothetical protein